MAPWVWLRHVIKSGSGQDDRKCEGARDSAMGAASPHGGMRDVAPGVQR